MASLRPPLRQTLESRLEPRLVKRYLRAGGESSEGLPARYFYNTALRDLSIKDSEKTINHLIMALDIDPEFTPALHLAKTMLFGLSKKYTEEGGNQHRQMYPKTAQRIVELEDLIAAQDRLVMRLRNDMLTARQQARPAGFFGRLFGGRSPDQVPQLEANLRTAIDQGMTYRRMLQKAGKFAQIEEYTRVLGMVLEVCLYPSRYVEAAPADRATIQMKVKERFWYG